MMFKLDDDDDDGESIVKTSTCIVASIVFQEYFFTKKKKKKKDPRKTLFKPATSLSDEYEYYLPPSVVVFSQNALFMKYCFLESMSDQ